MRQTAETETQRKSFNMRFEQTPRVVLKGRCWSFLHLDMHLALQLTGKPCTRLCQTAARIGTSNLVIPKGNRRIYKNGSIKIGELSVRVWDSSSENNRVELVLCLTWGRGGSCWTGFGVRFWNRSRKQRNYLQTKHQGHHISAQPGVTDGQEQKQPIQVKPAPTFSLTADCLAYQHLQGVPQSQTLEKWDELSKRDFSTFQYDLWGS